MLALSYQSSHIANVLRNVEPKFLLCKNYWGDNNFIDYYRFNIRQLLVTNFYNNLMLLYREGKINRFCNYLKIRPRLSLKKEDDDIITYYKEDGKIVDPGFSNIHYIKDQKTRYQSTSLI